MIDLKGFATEIQPEDAKGDTADETFIAPDILDVVIKTTVPQADR